MYVLKIILTLLTARLSQCQSEDPSQSYDVTSSPLSYSTPSSDANEELRSLSTSATQEVVSIGYTRHKPDRHKPADHAPQISTEAESSPFPVGYDQHPASTTQATFKYTASSPHYDTSTGAPPLPSHYLDTTLSPPLYEHYTIPAKYQTHNQELYQPTRSPLLNHQSTPITLEYDKHGSTTIVTSTTAPPLEQLKGTPAPLPPQYHPASQYHVHQAHFSPLPQTYAPQLYSPPAPVPSSPYYPTPSPIPHHQYDYYQTTSAPVPYEHYLSQGPPVPPHYPPNPQTHSAQSSFSPASGSIHLTTTPAPHGEIGSSTVSVYDYSTVAPLQPQYDFIRENYENTETSQPPPQPYDHSLSLAPPVPPEYDSSAYLTIPNPPNYLDTIYRPYSTPLRKHNPSPAFEFNPTPHNPTHYIHNIPHYLNPAYDAYTKGTYPNGAGHPHYYKPLYNPYNPSVPQYSPGPGVHHYNPSQHSQPSQYLPQISQYESYNYPPIYRPPVPPNYQPHLPPKQQSTLYHLQASKELNPASSSTSDPTHELKEAREYKQHGYHNYQVTESPASYNVKEG